MIIVLIFLSLIIGITLGFWLFSKRPKSEGYISSATTYTIYLLIFSMGLAVGINKTLVENIFTVGWQAILIAICSMFGSISIAYIFFKYIFKKI